MNRFLPAAGLGALLLGVGLAAPAFAQGGTSTTIAGAAAAPAHDSTAADYPADAPDWLPMSDAIAAAKADSDIVLVHAYAVWCGWCRRLDHETYTDDAVQAFLADNYKVTRLDIESSQEVDFFGSTAPMRALAQAFEVTGTPTTLFFDADGNYLTKAPGYWPADQFLLVLRYVKEGFYGMMPFADYVEMVEAEEGG